MIRHRFNKHRFIKEFQFSKNKTIIVNYIPKKSYEPKYLVNPDHIFYSNGYTSILLKQGGAESINPLDFNSKFNEKDFNTAISSKLINETFAGLKKEKIDLMKVMLFANLLVTFILLYILLKGQGVV